MNVNVFNSVTSLCVLSYCCILHYSLTMPGGFNFNLTPGLKPQAGGIKIVTVYNRSIFQVEWLITTLVFLLVFEGNTCAELTCSIDHFRYIEIQLGSEA